MSKPLEYKLAPCGWRCPHSLVPGHLMGPFGNLLMCLHVGFICLTLVLSCTGQCCATQAVALYGVAAFSSSSWLSKVGAQHLHHV